MTSSTQQINTRDFVEKTIEFNVFMWISITSSTQQIDTRGFVEKWSLMCTLEFLWRVAHRRHFVPRHFVPGHILSRDNMSHLKSVLKAVVGVHRRVILSRYQLLGATFCPGTNFLATNGTVWQLWGYMRPIWGYMRVYEGIWGYVRYIWGYMKVYEAIWGYMRVYEGI